MIKSKIKNKRRFKNKIKENLMKMNGNVKVVNK